MEPVPMDISNISSDSDLSSPEEDYISIMNPIIYTTRLDEMKIFKRNLNDISLDSIVESIVRESKPKILKRKRRAHLVPPKRSFVSYQKLTNDIDTLNRIAATEKEERYLPLGRNSEKFHQDIKFSSLSRVLRSKEKCKKSNKINVRDFNRNDINRFFWRNTLMFYNEQKKEADIYFLDGKYFIKEYRKFQTDKFDDRTEIFCILQTNKNAAKIKYCCWYKREKCIMKLAKYPQETVMFLRQPHRCSTVLCHCCCRDDLNQAYYISTKVKTNSDNFRIWFQMLPSRIILFRPGLIPKSIHLLPKASPNTTTVTTNKTIDENEVTVLKSTLIKLNDEIYQIGPNGQIELFLKQTEKNKSYHTYSSHLISAAENIVTVNVCCWYKREQVAARLLKLGALTNTINFIRSPHQCSTTQCTCCCKLVKDRKTSLTLFPIAARYTNELADNKLKLYIRFPKPIENAIKISPATNPKNKDSSSGISFNLSFNKTPTVHDNVFKERMRVLTERVTLKNPAVTMKILDRLSEVKFFFNGTAPYYTFAKLNRHLISLSKTELKLLEHCFSVINKTMLPDSIGNCQNENKIVDKPVLKSPNLETSGDIVSQVLQQAFGITYKPKTCYPTQLYSDLTIAANLKMNRYIQPFREYTHNLKVTDLRNIQFRL